MALQDRNIDQIVPVFYALTDGEFLPVAVCGKAFFLLGIDQGDAVFLFQIMVAAIVEGFGSPVAYPGPLSNDDVLKPSFLQKLNDSRENLGVSGSAKGSRSRCDQIGLNGNAGGRRRQKLSQTGLGQKSLGHIFIIRSVGTPDFIFLHKQIQNPFESFSCPSLAYFQVR